MSDTDKKIDQDKGDELLKRLLKTPPKPKGKDKDSLTKSDNGDDHRQVRNSKNTRD